MSFGAYMYSFLLDHSWRGIAGTEAMHMFSVSRYYQFFRVVEQPTLPPADMSTLVAGGRFFVVVVVV